MPGWWTTKTRQTLRHIGGRVSDVELKKTVIASANIMEADVVAVDVFGDVPEKYGFIKAAFDKGMGQMDLAKINLKVLT